jgi:hypothetical protein
VVGGKRRKGTAIKIKGIGTEGIRHRKDGNRTGGRIAHLGG